MNKSQARITCIIVLFVLLGVVIYGETKTETEQKPTLQEGEDTADTNTSGRNGVGNNGLSKNDRQPTSGTIYGDTDSEHMEEASDGKPTPSINVESDVVTIGRGAGNSHSVTVADGLYYYTAEELEKGLLHDLKPLAPLFIQAQEKYGIDAVFLAAVAAEESGWGRYQFRQNNIFGFYGPQFESLEHCIDHVANFLLREYLTPSGKYYKGTSVAAVNTYYNGRDTWEEHVTSIMASIVNRIERTDK